MSSSPIAMPQRSLSDSELIKKCNIPSQKNNFPNTRMQAAIKQSFSKQDMIVTGKYIDNSDEENSFQWIVCADGHGSNLPCYVTSVIGILRKLDWDDIVMCKSAEEFNTRLIHDNLKKYKTYLSGSTLSIVKIYSDHFDCYWIGDSEIRIYVNHSEIFKMNSHNHLNKSEMERIEKLEIDTRDSQNIQILDTKKLTMVDGGKYFYYTFCDGCNMTRFLGHNQTCKEFIEHVRVPRESNLKYKVIVASDGLWDMVADQNCIDINYLSSLENEAQKLVDFAYNRWTQEWIFERENNAGEVIRSMEQFKPNTIQIDDVCVATWIEL